MPYRHKPNKRPRKLPLPDAEWFNLTPEERKRCAAAGYDEQSWDNNQHELLTHPPTGVRRGMRPSPIMSGDRSRAGTSWGSRMTERP